MTPYVRTKREPVKMPPPVRIPPPPRPAGLYEPPTVVLGTPFRVGQETLLAPGVRGYAIEQDGEVWIPVILAENEGAGAVGRFLDSLSPRCVIPCVFNPRLMGMLARRGWVPTFKDDGEEWRRR